MSFVKWENCHGIGLYESGVAIFFSLVELWRNTVLKKFGVELGAGVELGGTL